MSPKDMKKWDDKVREIQIAYQMRMGQKNKSLNGDLRRNFVTKGGKDDSMFQQTINDIIYMLDTAKENESDHRKLQDGMRNGRSDSCQNPLGTQQENTVNEDLEEDHEAEEVSGVHTYNPLTKEKIWFSRPGLV